ncbi:sensor histidine kinase [Cellulomonas sp. 179-A 9B4 NHS]|uniref:sensor histidine kinase n=1 Tax=Cellulomonas sp. 179-A 9B4 NHS TaxID=3142379 RepID=UPI0039A19B2D
MPAPVPAPAPPAPPPLGPWSRTWRYLVAAAVGLVTWALVLEDVSSSAEAWSPVAVLALLLDLVLGAVATGLLALRRRTPLATALVTAALTTVSSAAVGAAVLALVSVSTRRRWREVLTVGAVWLVAMAGSELVFATLYGGERTDLLPALALTVLLVGLFVAVGFYVGARRDLVRSLRERAEAAEAAQESRAEQARAAERTRIAREMHDVLAHRISLVALQAGGLAYRDDLTQEQARAAAETIRDSAHRALEELREVLGVLRADDPGPAEHEPPQPTLDELPALLADLDEAGATVALDVSALPGAARASLADVPTSVSRTAFRLLQEALTNAQKHAPGAPVDVRLAGAPGERLEVTVTNPLPVAVPVGADDGPRVPGAGLGLVGAHERAALAGGGLAHGREQGPDGTGRFVVRAWLPWSA